MTNAEIFARATDIPINEWKLIAKSCIYISGDPDPDIGIYSDRVLIDFGFSVVASIYIGGNVQSSQFKVNIPALINFMRMSLTEIDKAKTEHKPE